MLRYVPASLAAAVLLTAAAAVGAEPVPDPLPPGSQVYYHRQPAGTPQTQRYYYAQPQQEQERPSFFGRMMELERRKNRAILRFFGFR